MSVAPAARIPAPTVGPAQVEAWLGELGLEPSERVEREGITSWDLVLDGHRRFDLRITVILDPDLALICWAHYAPPINDSFRKTYRRLLRWNDEVPFAKFSVSEDERPVLTAELAIECADADGLGLALARMLAVADRFVDESRDWIWLGGRMPSTAGRTSRGAALLARYAPELAELTGPVTP